MLQAQGRQPHEEVRKFYASHYSSNIMKGAVMGPQSLDELERMVRSNFQAVGNADLRPAEFHGVRPAAVPDATARRTAHLHALLLCCCLPAVPLPVLQHAVSLSGELSTCISVFFRPDVLY